MSRSPRSAAWQLPHRRLVQVAVWVLFALLLVAGTTLTAHAAHPQPTGNVIAAHQVLADTPQMADGQAGDLSPASPLCQYSMQGCAGTAADANNPMNLLPAWRWDGAIGLSIHKMSFMEVLGGGGFLTAMGALFFTLAGFAWSILMWLMQYALGMSLLANAGHTINRTAGQLGAKIIESPIVWIVAAVGLLAVIRAGLKGNLPRVLGLVLAFAIPVGALQMMASAASSDSKKTVDGQNQVKSYADVPAGSPAWLAIAGNNMVTNISTAITTGFGTTTSLQGSSNVGTYSTAGLQPGCDSYIADLYATFKKAQADGNAPGDTTNALVTVSYLWDRSFYQQWTVTQLGNMSDGGRVACHRLEQRANIPASEQLAVVANDPNYHGVAIGPFLTLNDDSSEQAQMLAWAACRMSTNGGKVDVGAANAAWLHAGLSKNDNADEAAARCLHYYRWDPITNNEDKWADGEGGINQGKTGIKAIDLPGQPIPLPVPSVVGKYLPGWASTTLFDQRALEWSGPGSIQSTFNANGKDAATRAQYHAAEQLVLNWYGTNTSALRLVEGLIALITACIYTYAFGGMALGSIIAQVGLGVMLALLPATLVALAMPVGGGEKAKFGQHPLGKKLLRLTGGFLAGKFILVTAMSFLFTMIDIFQGVMGNTGAGISSGLLSALVPLGALFVLKMILKNMGLGNITSLQGAVGLAGAAAFAATGDKSWQRAAVDGFNNSLAGRALGRADRMAKLTGTRAAIGKAVSKEVGYRKKQLGHHLTRGGLDPVTGERLNDGKRGFLRGLRSGAVQHGIERDAREAMWRKNHNKGIAGLSQEMFDGQTTNKKLDAQRKADELAKLPKTQAEREAAHLKQMYGDKAGQAVNKMGNRLDAAAELWQKRDDATVGAAADAVAVARAQQWDNGAPTYVDAQQVDAAAEERRRVLNARNNEAGTAEQALSNHVEMLERGLATQRMVYQKTTDAGVTESLTDAQRQAVVATYAKATGADVTQVVAGPLRPFIAPVTDRVIPQLSSDEATLAAAAHPIHWQPEVEKTRLVGESDEDYNIRQHAQLLARGWIDDAGNPVDMLVRLGYDVDKNPKDREVILKAAAGQATELKITAEALPQADKAAVYAAMESWRASAARAHTAADARRVTVDVSLSQAHRYDEMSAADVANLQKYAQQFIGPARDGIMTPEAYAALGDVIKLGEKIPRSTHQDLATIVTELEALTRMSRDPGNAPLVVVEAKAQEVALRRMVEQYESQVLALTAQMAKDVDVETQIDAVNELLQVVEGMRQRMSGSVAAAVRDLEAAQRDAEEQQARAAAAVAGHVARAADVAGGAESAPNLVDVRALVEAIRDVANNAHNRNSK